MSDADTTDQMTVGEWLEMASRFDRLCYAVGFYVIYGCAAMLAMFLLMSTIIGALELLLSGMQHHA